MMGRHREGSVQRLSMERVSFKGPSLMLCKDAPNYSHSRGEMAGIKHISSYVDDNKNMSWRGGSSCLSPSDLPIPK